MWKEFIHSISEDYKFKNPARKLDLAQIEKKLNIAIPEELASLLNVSNGVHDKWGCSLIWSTSQIIKDNLFYRNFEGYKDLYMPFDHLFFFTDAGNGDLFFYPILKNGTIDRSDIYVWNHEDDSRTWVASTLKDFIKRWITNEIEV